MSSAGLSLGLASFTFVAIVALELGSEPECLATDADVPGAVLAPPFVLGELQLVGRLVAVSADWLGSAGALVPRPVRVVLVHAALPARDVLAPYHLSLDGGIQPFLLLLCLLAQALDGLRLYRRRLACLSQLFRRFCRIRVLDAIVGDNTSPD